VNRIFICNTASSGEQARYLGLMKKMLKPGGQGDYCGLRERAAVGPPPEMKIAKDVVKELESGGFKHTRTRFSPIPILPVFRALRADNNPHDRKQHYDRHRNSGFQDQLEHLCLTNGTIAKTDKDSRVANC
jgi:hypothetical protein